MSNFWLYHDRNVGRARVHERHCVYCNDGHGQINKPRVPGGAQVWFPFDSLDAAMLALAALPSKDVRCCKSCMPPVDEDRSLKGPLDAERRLAMYGL